MENQEEGPSHMIHGFQGYHDQEQLLSLQQEQGHQYSNKLGGEGSEGFMFPPFSTATASSPILPWQLPTTHQHVDPTQFSAANNQIRDQSGFFGSLPPPPPQSSASIYADLYSRRASSPLQFAYNGGIAGSSMDPLGLSGLYMASDGLLRGGGVSSSSPFAGLHAEFGRMTAQEIMDAKALAASKSHSEAERRRRERINAHLTKLRSLLPSTTKTDKASLLAEVIQHVKELKRQTSEIAEESPLPTESDELTVDAASDEDGRFLVRASLCCEDRSDLLPDLIRALKSLRLRTLKAEITTLGGRVKNVLVVTGEDDPEQQQQQSIASIQDALKAVMERAATDETTSSAGTKRQRTTNLASILEHRSI